MSVPMEARTSLPEQLTGCYGTNGNTGLPAGFSGGTTGNWAWPATPVADPYAGVPAASGMKTITPATKASHSDGTKYYNLAAPEWTVVRTIARPTTAATTTAPTGPAI